MTRFRGEKSTGKFSAYCINALEGYISNKGSESHFTSVMILVVAEISKARVHRVEKTNKQKHSSNVHLPTDAN